jgi:hypothetical protein
MQFNEKENGWSEYQKLVLSELEYNNQAITKLQEQVSLIQQQLSAIQVKASMLGLFAGLVPGTAALILVVLKSIL